MKTVRSQDGTTIAFDQSGAGPAIILVLGAFNDHFTGSALAERLSEPFTVFNVDRRAHAYTCLQSKHVLLVGSQRSIRTTLRPYYEEKSCTRNHQYGCDLFIAVTLSHKFEYLVLTSA
jgi:hypothetical protein